MTQEPSIIQTWSCGSYCCTSTSSWIVSYPPKTVTSSLTGCIQCCSSELKFRWISFASIMQMTDPSGRSRSLTTHLSGARIALPSAGAPIMMSNKWRFLREGDSVVYGSVTARNTLDIVAVFDVRILPLRAGWCNHQCWWKSAIPSD